MPIAWLPRLAAARNAVLASSVLACTATLPASSTANAVTDPVSDAIAEPQNAQTAEPLTQAMPATEAERLQAARVLARAERERAWAQASVDESRGGRAARLHLSSPRDRERVRIALRNRCTHLPACVEHADAGLDGTRARLWSPPR